MKMPDVLGQTFPDPLNAVSGLSLYQFEGEQIQGQFWLEDQGRELHLLSILSKQPGKGHFKAWIERAKAEERIRAIYVWHVWNSDLEGMLRRWDFVEVRGRHRGEPLYGFCWKRKTEEKRDERVQTLPAEGRDRGTAV